MPNVRREFGDAPVVALRGERAPFDFGRALDRRKKKERLRRVALSANLCGGLFRLARDGTPLSRDVVGTRTTWWCPKHQR